MVVDEARSAWCEPSVWCDPWASRAALALSRQPISLSRVVAVSSAGWPSASRSG